MDTRVIPMKPRLAFVRVDPDANAFLALSPEIRDGAQDASIHRARLAQHREREQAIADALGPEQDAMLRQLMAESLAAANVEIALPADLARTDRRDAAAVAVRLHDPRWQVLSRYYAADAVLVELQKFFALGHGYATDSELRELADRIAGTAHTKRLMVWTGQIGVTARDWAKAALGLLTVRSDT